MCECSHLFGELEVSVEFPLGALGCNEAAAAADEGRRDEEPGSGPHLVLLVTRRARRKSERDREGDSRPLSGMRLLGSPVPERQNSPHSRGPRLFIHGLAGREKGARPFNLSAAACSWCAAAAARGPPKTLGARTHTRRCFCNPLALARAVALWAYVAETMAERASSGRRKLSILRCSERDTLERLVRLSAQLVGVR